MQSKGKPFLNDQQLAARRKRLIRNWSVLIAAVVLVVVSVQLLRGIGRSSELSVVRLPCLVHQDVTPFGNDVVYYDKASIHCLSTSGGVRWSYPIGENASFSVSDTHIVLWRGNQLVILDHNGKPTYNENMDGIVQFARIQNQYAAIVIGDDSSPTLLVKDMQGAQRDYESETFDGMLILDVGFYGDDDQYMWTLAMDVYGPAVSTVMNIFQVGRMNAGVVSLGEDLVYKVLYDNNRLRVFTTQHMYTYDYKGVQDASGTMLVYGWQLIDSDTPARGDARMLLTRTLLNNTTYKISQLRLIAGDIDKNYTLPSDCLGAAIQGDNIYAVSPDYLYHTSISSQHFYAIAVPLPDDQTVTNFLGLTRDGHAIVAGGNQVYSVTIPK